MTAWRPWHGCHRCSPGCQNCYVYRGDARFGRDASQVRTTREFDLPVRGRLGSEPSIPSGETVYTCLTSDFFIEEADAWRPRAWRLIRTRPDLMFYIITKRIERFSVALPEDWGEGYGNVTLAVTCENQQKADERIPALLNLPLRHRELVLEPLLGPVDILRYLMDGRIEGVTAGGESGEGARLCRYEWMLGLARQCRDADVPFTFKQTGANFEKDGRVYRIPRAQQLEQARRAGISTRRTAESEEEF